ncbi:retrovirus-related pol polyprotein from transposon TNT 1-94 [Tanacetum coccineum]
MKDILCDQQSRQYENMIEHYWHIILNGDFPPVARNKVTQVLEVVLFEERNDKLKKRLAKNNKAKIVLYNALPTKKYERIFMCKMAKDIWKLLLFTHPRLKALNEGFSSKNYVRKFLRALHPKWRAKEKERVKSIALKAKKKSSDDETLTSGSDDEEYAMAVRNFKKVVQKKGCGDLNHLIGDWPNPSRNKDQKAFIGGSWSDGENDAEDKTNDETCLMAQSSNEVALNSSYYSDIASSLESDSSSIIAIRTDHGREFDNEVQFGAYCDAQGITHNFSAPRTPQSNGVVERKNRTLQEMSRTMLNEQSIPQKFWCNAVDTSTYILNRILIRPILGKTPYEIFRGRKPSLEYFKVFGSKCFILNTKDYLTKFDPKSYEGVFLGYSQNSKAYVVLNKHTMKVEESLNVTFNESPPPTKLSPLVDDDVGEEEAIRKNTKIINTNNEEDESIEVDKIINIKESKNHPLDQVIGNLNQRTLRSQAQNHSNFFFVFFIYRIKPKQ